MRKNLRNSASFRGWSAFVVVFFLALSGLEAQSHLLSIDSASSVGGLYAVQVARFGPVCDLESISAEMELVVDGTGGNTACDVVTNDLTNKIAVIDRGGCEFSVKVFNAQQAGAVGAIVCNNLPVTDPNGGIFSMAAGTSAELVSIPSLMLSLEDCDIIKQELGNGLVANINAREIDDQFTGTIVYEESFSCGLNGWTPLNITCASGATPTVDIWTWAEYGDVSANCFADGIGFLTTPTAWNGAAVVNSNFLDDPGADCGLGLGTGDCPILQLGGLVSPEIDLTNTPSEEDYTLSFYQGARHFGESSYFVLWSTDGGVNWDTVQLNPNIQTFDEIDPTVAELYFQAVPLTGSSGASSLQLQFLYQGDYYYWGVDDIRVTAGQVVNLAVTDWYALPPNAAVPASQVEPFDFMADVRNSGAGAAENVQLNVVIFDGQGQVVHSPSLDYGTIPPNTLDENRIFFDPFTPPGSPETYLGAYVVSSEGGELSEVDNLQEFELLVTDDLFTKELGRELRSFFPSPNLWDATEPHSAAYGNVYRTPNGGGYVVNSIECIITNPGELAGIGGSLVASIYKWEDINNDQAAQPDEREAIGQQIYTITGNENPPGQLGLISIPFDELTTPVMLEDNATYLAAVEYFAFDQTDIIFRHSTEYDYLPNLFLGDTLQFPAFTNFTGFGADLTAETYQMFGFDGQVPPVVRLRIDQSTSTNDLPDISNEFAVFPNPANDLLHVQFLLEDRTDLATVRIMDVAGKLILEDRVNNLQSLTRQYNLSTFANGTYFLQVRTATGVGTQKFVVQHEE